MLNDFLNQTCTIQQVNKTLVGWEEQITFTNIYTSIPCYYYKASQVVRETNEAINTDLSSYKVMLEPSRTNVRPLMIISITDTDLWNIWKFLIEWVKVNRLINWSRDSIEITLKKYE